MQFASFAVVQNGKQYTDLSLYEDGATWKYDTFCDTLLVSITLEYRAWDDTDPSPDMNFPFSFMILNTSPDTELTITPSTPQPVYPTEGIWKSTDEVLSMYLQRYQAKSCILVVTMGDGILTAFLDSSYTDGISASDVYGQGYTLSLTLTDASHGTLTVTLPGWGTVSTAVALMYGAE